MSIARLKKISLVGLRREKRDLLEGLQALGCMHLLPLRPPPAEVENAVSPRAEAALKALRILTDHPQKRRQVTRDQDFDVDALVEETLDLRQRWRDTSDRRDFLTHRIAAVEPWGDIDFPPEEALVGYRLWFYVLPLSKLGALVDVTLPWQILKKDHRLAYLVLIAKEEPAADLLPVPRIHMGALPARELKAQLEDVEVELEDLAMRRQALTRYIYLLSANLAAAENRAALTFAEQQTHDDEAVVAVQGWVPVDAVEEVERFAENAALACLIEEPRSDENPPTLIEEPDAMAAGVDLANFYQIPSYRSWDPSVVLFFSFSLFFAMILSDAGYGLVLMAGLLVFWRRLGQSATGRAYRLLGLSLFGCSILYGVLVGSYFGIAPPSGSVLDKLKILDVNAYQTMMTISIVVGVLHLVLGHGIVAYINRHRIIALASLGWIAGLFGGLFLAFSSGGSALQSAGIMLLASGLIAVFLFSSERPVDGSLMDYLLRALDGAKALTGVMSMFGDVLSYMRLFALGLASASLALTFNDLAMQVRESVPGLGLLLAMLLLVVGHTLNLGLSIMSGVVHGLRLNFMEFYKWAMPEEGRAFRKFARKEARP